MRRGILYRTVRGWDASRRIAPMGQCEVQIQADVGRAEPIHWKSCLIPLMHGFELVWFRCGIPAVVVSFLLIDCLDDLFLHAVIRFPDVNSHSCRMSRTNAPSDTMPHDSWLGCDPARCGNGAARGLSRIEADGGRAAWRAETMRIVRDFSAADGFRRDAHLDIRREAQWQTRPRRRSKLRVAAHARTDACRLDGRSLR